MTFAASTRRTYQTQMDTYLVFCNKLGYSPVPATSATLCRYAVLLARTHKFSSIKQYLNVIRILHAEWNLPNPLEGNFQLTCILKGIRRYLGDSVTRKLPITPSILLAILRHLNLDNSFDCNFWAICLCAFYAMLRRSNVMPHSLSSFNPAQHLRRKDLVFDQNGLHLYIRWTKTIQFRERTLHIPLPRIQGSPLCPSQAVYLACQQTSSANPCGPAFACNDSPNAPPITVSQFMKLFKSILDKEGIDSGSFSGYIFRRGGASWAF